MSEKLIKLFPKRRLQAYDGMAITAQVWDTAHTYHIRAQQAHNLFYHGSGILFGMEVIASDPPDQVIYILPGVAIDPYGQVIVLSDPVAYDLGNEIEGLLYLLISRRESKQAGTQEGGGEASYVQDEFLITARSSIPDSPVIELARFHRQSRSAVLQNATELHHPQPDQIDLRYRVYLHTLVDQLVVAAVVYLGEAKDHFYGRGLARLSDEFRRMPLELQSDRAVRQVIHLVVDDNVVLDPSVLRYNLICLVGRGKFQITANQLKGLQSYLEHGGTLFLEALDDTSKSAFVDLAFQMGLKLGPPATGHPLLEKPFLFAAPPPGFENRGDVLTGDTNTQPAGFILSTANYGGIWNGKARDRIATREEIRSAIEWGANLFAYVLERQAHATGE